MNIPGSTELLQYVLSLNVLIFVSVIVLYSVFVFLATNEYIQLPDSIDFFGPGNLAIIYRTQYGLRLVERISQFKQTWKILGNTGVVLGLLIMVFGIFFVLFSAVVAVLSPPEETISSPANFLVIPGVNDFLPLSVAPEIILGLVFAMVIHEAGHAILCRTGHIDIESTGLLFVTILPLGAFVEPDEESQQNATKINRLRMFSAGILNNVILTIVCILLLILVSSAITPLSGASIGSISSGTPADASTVEAGDTITTVESTEIETNEQFQTYFSTYSKEKITVITQDGDTHRIDRQLVVSQSIQTEKFTFPDPNQGITAINTESIKTQPGLEEYIRENSPERLVFDLEQSGETSVPLGALATLQETRSTESGVELQQGANIIITGINGTPVQQGSDVTSMSSIRTAADSDTHSVSIFYSESETDTIQLTTSELKDLYIYSGYSGLQFTDTGFNTYPTDTFTNILNFSFSDAGLWLTIFFFGPFLTLVGLEYNFFGFAGPVTEFYTAAMAEPLVFFVWNLLYWTAWININLAIFNCLPIAYMGLDGSKILKDSSSILGDKLGFATERFSTAIVTIVNLITFGALLVVVAISIL